MPGNLTFLQGCAASLVGQDVLVDTKALEAEPITVAGSALSLIHIFAGQTNEQLPQLKQ